MHALSIVTADITKVATEAIVNAANESLLGGGGVDGAIHAAAGPELLAACRALPEVRPGIRCPIGEARITPAFRLPSRHIIHTVGPRWRGGTQREPELLALCYRTCLSLAVGNGIRTIAFPAISTGAFAYPLLPACRIAVAECSAFLSRTSAFDSVILVAFSGAGQVALTKALASLHASRG